MNRLKVLLLAFVAVAAVGCAVVASASAITLPTVLFKSGEGTPAELNLTTKDSPTNNKIKSKLESATGAVLEGEGLLTKLNITNLEDTSDGNYETLFLEVQESTSKVKCRTPGDKTGEVLVPTNLDHLVFDNLATEAGGLGVGILFLVAQFTIECGALKVKTEGSSLSLLLPVNGGLNTKLSGALYCSPTKPGVAGETKYWNNNGELKKALLESNNGGSGFTQDCENITGELGFTANKEIEIMG